MYSGSDSTESLHNQKWPPSNSVYPNAPNDHIDWAALAQQWIIMKEAGPPVPDLMPPSPPPPPNIHDTKKDNLSEGGEAPMEVENDKEEATHSQWNEHIPPTEGSWSWNQQQQWGYSWNTPVPPTITKTPLLPTPATFNQYSAVPADVSTNFQYNSKPTATEYSGGYWTASGNKSKPHNKRFSKVNVPQRHPAPAATATIADPITLDATRRKQLPAWIRDGLEKMERDKMKQLEKEKEKPDKGDETKPKFNEKEALEIIKSTVKERERSKFDSDGEDSNNEIRNKSRRKLSPQPVMISYEDLMLRIRRTMTEILLKVTNQEILAVCKEEFQRRLRKRKASDHRVSASSGTNITAKLGVGIYGESGSSGDDSGSDSDRESVDSEAELKAVIRRRKAEFAKTEREIEERLAAAENPADEGDRAGTPDIYESQVDAKYQDYRVKSGSAGTASSPKYSSLKHTAGKSPSISSESDSDFSDKRNEKMVPNRKLSNSENSFIQRHARDHLIREDKSETPERNTKQKMRRSSERKYSDLYSRARRSRSKSNSSRRNRSRSRDRRHTSKTYSKRSRSRSSSRSGSYSKTHRSRKSRSLSRSRHRKSNSSERSSYHNKKSRLRHKSRSTTPEEYYRRSRSRSSSRGKRSRRH